MSKKRTKWRPEASAVSGPGVDFWRQADNNNHTILDEDVILSRRGVRKRFLEKQSASLEIGKNTKKSGTRKSKSA